VGAPWVFAEIRAALLRKELPEIDRRGAILHHIELAFRYKPITAGRELRTHMAHYMKGFRGAAALRERSSHAETKEDYLELLTFF